MIKILIGLIGSFFIGCAISSFFGRRKGESYYIFRTYQLYQEGKVDLMTVILAGFVNTILGGIIIGCVFIG
jgi:hypothetical protein